jgi:hypothetical protein
MVIKALIDDFSWRSTFRDGESLFFMPELSWLFSQQVWQGVGES